MQELITIDSAPAKLEANFEEVRQELDKHLNQYETVVTEDGVKDAKSAATEINKLRQEIKKRVKAAVDEVSAPIQDFKDKGKQLEDRCEEARQSILTQVQKYEDQTRELAQKLLNEERTRLWEELGVTDEFYRAEFDDLIKLTSVTGTGKLTASAKREIEQRCRDDKARQDRVKMRLLELENRSYKAGLSAPLTKDHVHQWLEADDETYETQLQRILDAEVNRQEQAEQRMRQQMEREQEQKEQAERERQERDERAQKAAEEQKSRAEPEAAPQQYEPEQAHTAPEGKQPVTVTCTFETSVGAGTPDSAIEDELRKVMAKAGISTLASVKVTRHESQAA